MTRKKARTKTRNSRLPEAKARGHGGKASPPSPLDVLPSATLLKTLSAGTTSIDVRPELLNPLQSLPRPLTIDEVRKRSPTAPRSHSPKRY